MEPRTKTERAGIITALFITAIAHLLLLSPLSQWLDRQLIQREPSPTLELNLSDFKLPTEKKQPKKKKTVIKKVEKKEKPKPKKIVKKIEKKPVRKVEKKRTLTTKKSIIKRSEKKPTVITKKQTPVVKKNLVKKEEKKPNIIEKKREPVPKKIANTIKKQQKSIPETIKKVEKKEAVPPKIAKKVEKKQKLTRKESEVRSPLLISPLMIKPQQQKKETKKSLKKERKKEEKPEMTKDEELNFSLNTYAWSYKLFMENWAVDLRKWWFPSVDYASGKIPEGGDIWLKVVLSKQGRLLSYKVLNSEVTDEMGLKVIQALIGSMKRPNLPETFPEEHLVVNWRFIYPPIYPEFGVRNR